MGWRQRFDPLRDQARRINAQSVRQQVGAIRQAGFRSEILVPIAAALILIFALVLSRFSAAPGSEIVLTPTQGAIAGLDESPEPPVTTPATSGYPSESATASGDSLDATETITPTATLTDTAIALGPSTGYPGPGDGPEPVGSPPVGEFPAEPTPDFSNMSSGEAQPVPTPALIPPVPGASSGTTSGYPGPQQTFPTSRPAAPARPQPPADDAPTTPGDADSFPTSVPQDGTGANPNPDDPSNPAASPAATVDPAATGEPTSGVTPTPEPTPLPPTEPPRVGRVLSGNLRWSAADGPIRITEDHSVAAGSSLTIEPGVEVQVSPGVRLTVAGTLRAQGTTDAPVRFGGDGGQWDAIVGVTGSTIILDGAHIRQAGANGAAISSTGGTLAIRNTSLTDNGGGIVSVGSALDLRESQIVGNTISGPAVNVQLPGSAQTTITGNTIRDNATPPGGAQIRLGAGNAAGPLMIEGNTLGGGDGIGVIVETGTPLGGTIRCNAFNGGTIGLQLSASVPDTSGFRLAIDNNSFVGQARYGVAATLAFNVTNNWWGAPTGPLHAQRNPQGRGVPVGVNLLFQPWLAERPGCSPGP